MDIMDDEDLSCSSTVVSDLDQNAIKSKIESKEYKLKSKKGRSKVWDIFGYILNEKGKPIARHVACKKCLKVLKYNTRTTSNLIKHTCYRKANDPMELTADNNARKVEADSKTRHKIAVLCTQWTLENCRPFMIVQDSGLKKIIEECILIGAKLGPNVNLNTLLPHPTTISRNIDHLYDVHFTAIKAEIKEIKDIGFALTCDMSTDNHLEKCFIALTIHYIANSCMCSKLLSMLSMEGEKPTDENILRKVSNSLEMYDCEMDKSIVVTDRESSIIAAFKQQSHVFCIAQMLQDVMQKSIMAVTEVDKLCQCCTKLVKYFERTGLNSKFKTSLKSQSSTRWNSDYTVLLLIENYWADIVPILEERNDLSKIKDIQLHNITEIIAILKPFHEAIDKLEGEKYPTIHLAYPYAHHLQKKCIKCPTESAFSTRFKNKLLENINSVVFANLKQIHKLAIFLFPPTKRMLLFDSNEKESVRLECKRIMRRYLDLAPVCSAPKPITLHSDEAMYDFLDYRADESSVDPIDTEIDIYESMTIKHSEDFNVLQWWELNKKELPLLYYTSCNVLCTPATSASSERIFSQARNLITGKRSKIASSHDFVNKIIFLQCNSRESVSLLFGQSTGKSD